MRKGKKTRKAVRTRPRKGLKGRKIEVEDKGVTGHFPIEKMFWRRQGRRKCYVMKGEGILNVQEEKRKDTSLL